MINSRAKGARAERLFASWLRGWLDPHGVPIEARRGQQFKGTKDSPDVIHTLKGVHFEVADRQGLDIGTQALQEKMNQADEDVAHESVPIVVWRKRKRWWMTATTTLLIELWESRDMPCDPIMMTAPAEDVMLALGCRRIEP